MPREVICVTAEPAPVAYPIPLDPITASAFPLTLKLCCDAWYASGCHAIAGSMHMICPPCVLSYENPMFPLDPDVATPITALLFDQLDPALNDPPWFRATDSGHGGVSVSTPRFPTGSSRSFSAPFVLNASVFAAIRYIPFDTTVELVGTNPFATAFPACAVIPPAATRFPASSTDAISTVYPEFTTLSFPPCARMYLFGVVPPFPASFRFAPFPPVSVTTRPPVEPEVVIVRTPVIASPAFSTFSDAAPVNAPTNRVEVTDVSPATVVVASPRVRVVLPSVSDIGRLLNDS